MAVAAHSAQPCKRLDEMLQMGCTYRLSYHDQSTACFAATPVTTISLEIGFGGGEHLGLAKASPDAAFIGQTSLMALSLLRHIEEQNLQISNLA